MNKVYISKETKTPMTLEDLKKESGWSDYDLSRIEGDHCECNGEGKFILLPADDPIVIEGGKRYMVCKECGCYSHL